jgi:hypothetical protein
LVEAGVQAVADLSGNLGIAINLNPGLGAAPAIMQGSAGWVYRIYSGPVGNSGTAEYS